MCQKRAHEMERGDRRTARGSSRGRPGSRARARALLRAPPRAGTTSPTGFSAVPPPGPAIPVTETATSAPSRSRAPAAIAAAVSAETAPCRSSISSGHAELARLHLVRVRDDGADEDVARARDRRQPRRHEPARARLGRRERQPALAAELEHELLDRPLVLGEQVRADALAQRRSELVRPLPTAGVDEEVDVDLEVARADRRRDPVALAPGLLERARDLPTRSRRRSGARAARASRAREQDRRTGSASSARGQSRCSSGGGPGKHDDRAALGLEHEAGRRAGEPERRRAPSGTRRLLADARLEVGVRPPQPLRDRARDRLDLGLQARRRRTARAPRRARRSSTVRSSCVGPSPPGDDAEVGVEPLAQRRLELLRVVADDRDPRRLEPEPQQLRGEERPVRVACGRRGRARCR